MLISFLWTIQAVYYVEEIFKSSFWINKAYYHLFSTRIQLRICFAEKTFVMEVNILKLVPLGLKQRAWFSNSQAKLDFVPQNNSEVRGHVMSFITVKFGGKFLVTTDWVWFDFPSGWEAFSERISLRFVLIIDNEEELFNPNCVTVNLLDNLRRRCGCQKGSMLP